jgi:hypothetical protein
MKETDRTIYCSWRNKNAMQDSPKLCVCGDRIEYWDIVEGEVTCPLQRTPQSLLGRESHRWWMQGDDRWYPKMAYCSIVLHAKGLQPDISTQKNYLCRKFLHDTTFDSYPWIKWYIIIEIFLPEAKRLRKDYKTLFFVEVFHYRSFERKSFEQSRQNELSIFIIWWFIV